MKTINKKNLYSLFFVIILLGLIISLSGCEWLTNGLFGIIDPWAALRVNYTEVDLVDGTITLEVYTLNEVEFIGTGFEYDYYVGTTKIPALSKMVGATFYVAPTDSTGVAGPITTIESLPLYFQEVLDYITLNPMITELKCTVNLIGTDGAGHAMSKSVTVDLPAIQPGVDFIPPEAKINVIPGISGEAPFIVTFNALDSKDNRGIASYDWDFGDGTTGTGVIPNAHTYTESGVYVVILTVTDYFGNMDMDSVTITVGDENLPAQVNLTAIPTTVTAGGGKSLIIADIKNASGDSVPDGMTVNFSTTFGSLSSYSETTTNGIAKTELTLSSEGDATVSAQAGSIINTVIVTCPPLPVP